MALKFSNDEIKYLALFESLTGASVKDCLVYEDKVIFVVKKGDMGLAIGKGGVNVERMKEIIGKKIEIIEHSDDPAEFVANIFKPINVKVMIVEKDGKNVAQVIVNPNMKGIIIGKGGKNINKARELVRRHHDIEEVVVR